MRNLFLFFVKYNFFFLFVLLEIFCIYLISQNNSFQGTVLLNSANNVSGNFYKAISNTKEYLSLKEENDRLMKEHAMLYSRLREAYDIIPLANKIVKDTLYRQQYTYIPGKVVNNTTNRRSNYVLLNIGKDQGVVEGMGVFCSMGIVGVVKNTSPNFSSCMSFLHKDVMINGKLKRDGTYGGVKWDGSDYRYAYMYDVPTHADIRKGDSVVTSSLSGLFPEGIAVGIVDTSMRKAGEQTYTVRIRLSTDFKKVNHVYVLNNLLKTERDTLEAMSQKEVK